MICAGMVPASNSVSAMVFTMAGARDHVQPEARGRAPGHAVRVGHVEGHGDDQADQPKRHGDDGKGSIRAEQEDVARGVSGKDPPSVVMPNTVALDGGRDQSDREGHPEQRVIAAQCHAGDGRPRRSASAVC